MFLYCRFFGFELPKLTALFDTVLALLKLFLVEEPANLVYGFRPLSLALRLLFGSSGPVIVVVS